MVSELFIGRKSGILGGTLTVTHRGILYRMLHCRAGYGYIPPPGRDISISCPGEYIQNAALRGGIYPYSARANISRMPPCRAGYGYIPPRRAAFWIIVLTKFHGILEKMPPCA